MNQEKRPIALEDLLRLKRAERPPAEFWTSFDRELRAKQLAALVEKRPWWRSLPAAFANLTKTRYHLPLGATAVLAITFLATRDHQSAAVSNQPATPTTIAVARADNASAPVATVQRAATSESTDTQAADDTSSAPATVAAANNPTEVASAEETETTLSTRRLDTPSGRAIAENLKAAQAAEPAIARSLLSRSQGFENRGLTAKVTTEPLARMTTPTNARFAKFNSALMNSAAFKADNSAVTSERVASRLSTDQLYDQVSRFRANGGNHGIGFDTRL